MSTAAKSFEKTGLAARWETKAEERKAIDVAKKMIVLGLPVETIVSATELEIEKVKALHLDAGVR